MSAPGLQDLKTCPHIGFQLNRKPGYGYEAYCPDCGTRAEEPSLAHKAVEAFDKKINKARQAEKRETRRKTFYA
jgi:hypothetical protein